MMQPPGFPPAGPPGYAVPPGAPPFLQQPGAPPAGTPAPFPPPAAPTFGPPPGVASPGTVPFVGAPGMPMPAPAAMAPVPAAPAGAPAVSAPMPAWLAGIPAAQNMTANAAGGGSMGPTFGKIANAQLTGDGNYFRDGHFIVVLKNLLWEDRQSGKTLIAEMIVLESLPQLGMYASGGVPQPADYTGAVQVVPQAPGEQVSFTSQPDSATNLSSKGHGLAFLLALFGIDKAQLVQAQQAAQVHAAPYLQAKWPYEQWPEEARDPLDVLTTKFVSSAQPGRGMMLRVDTGRVTSKGRMNPANKGKILVIPKFTHIASTQEENKRRRDLIDACQPLPPTKLLAPAVAAAHAPAGYALPGPAAYAPVQSALGMPPAAMPAPGTPSAGVSVPPWAQQPVPGTQFPPQQQ